MREPKKGGEYQNFHIDWRPRRRSAEPFSSCIAFVFLDDSTRDNGATRAIPGSHRRLGDPGKSIANPRAPHPEEEILEAPRGSIVCINAHLWHGGPVNTSGRRRRALIVNYRYRKHWQQLNQRKFISSEVLNDLNQEEKYLLAVRDTDPAQNDWLFARRNSWYVRLFNVFQDANRTLRDPLPK